MQCSTFGHCPKPHRLRPAWLDKVKQQTMEQPIHDAVRALAEADFTHIADCFANAGFTVRLPARGILQVISPSQQMQRVRLLISVGIHGDETGPIEMLAHLLSDMADTPHELAVDLMVVVGNLGAIAQGRRFLEADMNRLFCADRGALQAAVEAERADVIMRATTGFFGLGDTEKWHLDLHTAIRPSHYPMFAVVPATMADTRKQALIAWLGQAGIGAAILNPKPAGTFSAYTATHFGAASSTVELGQVGTLGSNDLSMFAEARVALDGFIRSGRPPVPGEKSPHVFKVAQEIFKQSDAFQMAFDRSTKNFTSLEPDAVIANDGESVYRVGHAREYVVFPNPDVRVGQRAGLMVVREESP